MITMDFSSSLIHFSTGISHQGADKFLAGLNHHIIDNVFHILIFDYLQLYKNVSFYKSINKTQSICDVNCALYKQIKKPDFVMEIKKKGVDTVTFCHIPMTGLEEKRLINKYTKKIMMDPKKQWLITYRRYTNQKWDQLFRFMIEADVHELWLSFNMQKNIIKDINNVRFPTLLKIHLWQNNINSLEPMEFLNAPNLKCINVLKNQITNLKPIRKFISYNIEEVHYENNPIRNIAPLQLISMKTKVARVLYNETKQEKPILINDITNFIKIEANELLALDVNSRFRMRQPRTEYMMNRKYLTIKMKLRDLGKNYYQDHEIKKLIDTPRLEDKPVYIKNYGNIMF